MPCKCHAWCDLCFICSNVGIHDDILVNSYQGEGRKNFDIYGFTDNALIYSVGGLILANSLETEAQAINVTKEMKIFDGIECPFGACKSLFTSISSLQRHLKSVHALNSQMKIDEITSKVNKVCCPYCTTTFVESFMINKHLIFHCEENPHAIICSNEHCGKWFRTNEELIGHKCDYDEEKLKTIPKSLFCRNGCGKYFRTKELMGKHATMNCSRLNNQKNCEYCGFNFVSPVSLRNHMKNACKSDKNPFTLKRNETQYVCEICNTVYPSDRCLKALIDAIKERRRRSEINVQMYITISKYNVNAQQKCQ